MVEVQVTVMVSPSTKLSPPAGNVTTAASGTTSVASMMPESVVMRSVMGSRAASGASNVPEYRAPPTKGMATSLTVTTALVTPTTPSQMSMCWKKLPMAPPRTRYSFPPSAEADPARARPAMTNVSERTMDVLLGL